MMMSNKEISVISRVTIHFRKFKHQRATPLQTNVDLAVEKRKKGQETSTIVSPRPKISISLQLHLVGKRYLKWVISVHKEYGDFALHKWLMGVAFGNPLFEKG